MNLHIVAEILLGIFAATAVLVEVIRAKTVNPASTWISTYLTGPGSYWEDAGFVALGASLLLFPHIYNMHLLPTILFTVGAIGAALTMVTRKYFSTWFPSMSAALITRMHVISAGLAFAGSTAGLAIAADTPVRVVLAVTAAACLSLFMDKGLKYGQQLAEKIGAAGITLAALIMLFGF